MPIEGKTQDEIVEELKKKFLKRGDQAEFAYSKGLTRNDLNRVLQGDRLMSDTVAEKLGFERVMVFVEKEPV